MKTGNVFSQLHRQLQSYRYMSDIDDMSLYVGGFPAIANTENEMFCEYQIDKNGLPSLSVSAIFDFKYSETEAMRKAISVINPGSSIWMQIQLASKLNCKFFVVFADHGEMPLTFYQLYPVRRICGVYYEIPRDDLGRQRLAEFWEKRLGL